MSSTLPPELIASAAYILTHNLIDVYKRPRRYQQHALYKERSGSAFLLDLKTQKLGGNYKNFTRLNPTDFEYLMFLIVSYSNVYLSDPTELVYSCRCQLNSDTSHRPTPTP
jgi:hypothetical protein